MGYLAILRLPAKPVRTDPIRPTGACCAAVVAVHDMTYHILKLALSTGAFEQILLAAGDDELENHYFCQTAVWEMADENEALKITDKNLLAQQQAVAKATAVLTDLGPAANTVNDTVTTTNAQMTGAS